MNTPPYYEKEDKMKIKQRRNSTIEMNSSNSTSTERDETSLKLYSCCKNCNFALLLSEKRDLLNDRHSSNVL